MKKHKIVSVSLPEDLILRVKTELELPRRQFSKLIRELLEKHLDIFVSEKDLLKTHKEVL